MERDCKIVTLDEDADDHGGHDIYALLDQVEDLFGRCKVRYDECERPFEACVDPEGRVLGASTLGLYDPRGDEADPHGRPRWMFSVAVDERARRQGIGKALVESIISAKPREDVLLEGKVVNPYMSRLLSDLGFVRAYGEDDDEEWTDLDLTIGRRMYRPNPGRRSKEREHLARRAASGDLGAAKRLVAMLEGHDTPTGQLDQLVASLPEPLQAWIVLVETRQGNFVDIFVHEDDAYAYAAGLIRGNLAEAYEQADAEEVMGMPDKEVIMTWTEDDADSRARYYVNVFQAPIRRSM